MPARERPLLICFDDSSGARHAVTEAATLFPGAAAVILHVWRPLEATAAYRYSAAGVTGALDEQMRELDAAGQEAAQAIAKRGAELAGEAGLSAELRAVEVEDHEDLAVRSVADQVDARVIVMGSRQLGAIQAMALGGFSHGVLHSSNRPVLIVPSRKTQ
jgi:nucleotide-binding universal stress UspA family protein